MIYYYHIMDTEEQSLTCEIWTEFLIKNTNI